MHSTRQPRISQFAPGAGLFDGTTPCRLGSAMAPTLTFGLDIAVLSPRSGRNRLPFSLSSHRPIEVVSPGPDDHQCFSPPIASQTPPAVATSGNKAFTLGLASILIPAPFLCQGMCMNVRGTGASLQECLNSLVSCFFRSQSLNRKRLKHLK
jgi:hypothetical protein